MKNKIAQVFLYVSIFFGIILLFTHGLFNNFFEQDEWGAIGVAIHANRLPWWDIFVTRGFHFSPIGYVLWTNLYRFFGLHAEYYTFLQLLMHATASYLVFLLSSKLAKDKKIGILTAVLFATNGRAHQAFTHLAINTTVGAYIFILLFFVYLAGIREKVLSRVNVLVLYLIFLAAVFIREEGVMIVPLFGMYLLLFDRAKINKKNILSYISLGVGLILFLILRYISQLLNTTIIPDALRGSYGSVVYNLFSLPVKFIAQNIVSGVSVFRFLVANGARIYSDTQISVLGTYPVFMDLAFSMIFILIVIIFATWLILFKNKHVFGLLVFCVSWLLCNDVILAFVGRRLYIVEERYLYFSSFPVLLLVSVCAWSVFRSGGRSMIGRILRKGIPVLFIGFLLVTSYTEIQAAVKYKTFNGVARKHLLGSITSLYPTIPNNTIFYVRCKDTCHKNELFGLSSEWTLPFSSGPGWNLLVVYSGRQEAVWGKFLTNDFLLNLNSQGYKKIGSDGFGYFTDKDTLVKTLHEYAFDSSVVIALEYDENDFSVGDISNEFRLMIDEK